jgi:hypothetical protein
MNLSEEQIKILEGLSCCSHCHISATEMRHCKELESVGLVEVWSTGAGFRAWRILPKGTTALAERKPQ